MKVHNQSCVSWFIVPGGRQVSSIVDDEHIKDVIILTCATQELSIFSNYMWLFLLGAPIRAFYMLWVSVIAPWIFAPAEEEDAVSDKKRQKMERKMKRQQR